MRCCPFHDVFSDAGLKKHQCGFGLVGLVTVQSIAEAHLFNFPVLFMMSSSSGSSAAANLGSSSAHLTDAVLQTQQLKPARSLDGAPLLQ